MSKKNSLQEVPFEQRWRYDGNERVDLGWHMASYPMGNVEWRPNTPFDATLRLVGNSRGRSSSVFTWVDIVTGTEYPMFNSGLVELIQSSEIRYGKLRGTWIAVKRGANYGIELVGIPDE